MVKGRLPVIELDRLNCKAINNEYFVDNQHLRLLKKVFYWLECFQLIKTCENRIF